MARGPAEPAPRPWRDLGVRAVSALILAPLGLAVLWWGGLAWTVLTTAMTVLAGAEWAAMWRARYGRRHAVAQSVVGVLYLLPALLVLQSMRADGSVGRANVMFLVLIVWGTDIGAYVIGRLIGGPRLAPRISPGKTLSGAVGGLVVAVLIGWAAAVLWQTPPLHGAVVGGVLGVVCQLGDLFESAAKRHFGVKDSGRLIPGHGGVLDRVDGLLTAAPAAGVLVMVLGQGRVLWQ